MKTSTDIFEELLIALASWKKCSNKDYKILECHSKNLVSFLLLDVIPNDLRMSIYMDLTKNTSRKIKDLIKDKKLAKTLLQGM